MYLVIQQINHGFVELTVHSKQQDCITDGHSFHQSFKTAINCLHDLVDIKRFVWNHGWKIWCLLTNNKINENRFQNLNLTSLIGYMTHIINGCVVASPKNVNIKLPKIGLPIFVFFLFLIILLFIPDAMRIFISLVWPKEATRTIIYLLYWISMLLNSCLNSHRLYFVVFLSNWTFYLSRHSIG